jgi:ATP-dependent protease ClpP protease subunit
MAHTPDWLQEKLFERRMVLVTGRLDDALASQAAAQIMTLDATGDEPIDLVVDSAEGTLEAAFVLIEVIMRRARRCGCSVAGGWRGRRSASWRRVMSARRRRIPCFG